MERNNALLSAYRWHRTSRNRASRWRPIPSPMEALKRARDDVATGRLRYPDTPAPAVTWQSPAAPHDPIGTWSNPYPRKGERLAYVEHPEKAGLRLVGRVQSDCVGRNGYWDSREESGWYTDPYGDTFRDGSGLCYGLVYQLPGRDGKARFVAGYQFGGCDGGPTVDLGAIYETDTRDHWSGGYDPQEVDGARDAARAADSMAQRAAEDEREYQTAWQAGSHYANARAEAVETRRQLRELLADRRKARAIDPAGFPAICAAIRSNVARALDDLREARDRMRQLADGDYSRGSTWLGFYTGDKRLCEAFNEGAGESVLPV